MSDKQQRVDRVNELIRVIGDHGRRFFYDESKDRYASMEVDSRGRVWFIDSYSGKRIYTHYDGRWKGFSNGGTLKCLVEAFRNYISKSTPIPSWHFGPWPDHYCSGNLWGYGEDMGVVRGVAKSLVCQ